MSRRNHRRNGNNRNGGDKPNMHKVDPRKEKHDGLVYILRDVINGEEKYDEIKLFYEYCRNGVNGEVDLLAIAHHVGFNEIPSYDFYEVKSTYSRKSRVTAGKQFRRFQLAYPKYYRDGYMFTEQGLIHL